MLVSIFFNAILCRRAGGGGVFNILYGDLRSISQTIQPRISRIGLYIINDGSMFHISSIESQFDGMRSRAV